MVFCVINYLILFLGNNLHFLFLPSTPCYEMRKIKDIRSLIR